ncbi:MAG: ABC transporter substrate-binding protein [Bosea sp. (in: a-proteobacteria)]|uniref:ABC transporter substrate-binding protein n=1 Tax=unclassified Bosea (in: a-proteobacteria) TaxID=2653178 RepID=UPI000B163160|nr:MULTISPECIES: ABC transporter substrate-binding protein [unclassified Bosea (in: a-proteobacteria)]MBN9443086.1 ABC transporter substrate-binding protein [Bosea sp. (in: a-proteobacteria)]MBN9456217.1 ABC transporter substrate-binding protein [Bosea sp. (in: a-proteobacteria)]
MKLTRRDALAALAASTAVGLSPATVLAQAAEKPKLTLGVGGKPLLYYLPLTVAEKKGFFKDQGLDVEINDFGGGAKSLQALVGGSVDVVTGAYEHTIRMQAKGQDIRAVIELGRFPGIVIAVRKDLADKVKTAADFKGLKVGVTAPGSSTSLTAQYAMVKAGLKPTDAAFIGVGGGASAVAAIKQKQVDVISHLDPVISKLEADGDIVSLIDTRTEAGTKALFGGSNPAAVLYLKNDFAEKNPVTTQKLVNAFMKALKWLETAKPEEVADLVPQEYLLGDRPLYIRAVKNSLESYSRTGIAPPDGMKSMYDSLKLLDPELSSSNVDLSKTFIDSFAKKAASGA